MITKAKTITQSTESPIKVDWEIVYSHLLPGVYRYFCYRVGEGQVAEDLTATTFEKAWKKRRQYRKDASAFSTWIFTIARNVVIDYFRTTHLTVSLDIIEPFSANAESLETDVERREVFAQISSHISQLPERQQEILALKYGAGMGNSDIAGVTGLTASNIGVIVHRALSMLRFNMGIKDE